MNKGVSSTILSLHGKHNQLSLPVDSEIDHGTWWFCQGKATL